MFENLQLKKDKYQVDYLGGPEVIPAGGSGSVSNRLFAGAKEVKLLDSYEENLNISNENNVYFQKENGICS